MLLAILIKWKNSMAKDNTGVKPLKDGISIKAVDVFLEGGW